MKKKQKMNIYIYPSIMFCICVINTHEDIPAIVYAKLLIIPNFLFYTYTIFF